MPDHGRISTYTNYKCRCDACRESWREYSLSYYRRKPEIGRAKRKRSYREWKKFAISYLGGRCKVCGSLEKLEFHHVDPDEKNNSITSMLGLSKERLVAELDKCELLCHDCHWGKTRANGRVGRWKRPKRV